jgi:DNA invertase Pin-like site-specific DNA recombinase
MEKNNLVPAAQYLRMSTEHQQYSTQNQTAAIEAYAAREGFEIIQSYADGARSGLLLRNRPSLGQLLQHVISGAAEFKAVLVYDISRWGRFQDSDEAAHYEFICKNAGVPVHYCSETFANDSSLPSLVMKAVKRAMAAQYSRELGERVFVAGRRWAEVGMKQGGAAGYALSRLLIAATGEKKQFLGLGEVKCLQSDRVILVHGDPDEVACVREIFRLIVDEKKTPFAVARELNQRQCPNRGRKWTHQQVYAILTHPKYAGCNVWNRTTRKLGGPSVRVPRDMWVVKAGAFEPIIPPHIFEQAQNTLRQRNCCKSDEELIETLRELRSANGKISGPILANSPGAPSKGLLIKRFGSLGRAIRLASSGCL